MVILCGLVRLYNQWLQLPFADPPDHIEGPTEITVFAPEVKWAVDGPTNQCNKAVWYDILLPLIALNTTRSKKEHDQRRRTWDRAFTLRGERFSDSIETLPINPFPNSP